MNRPKKTDKSSPRHFSTNEPAPVDAPLDTEFDDGGVPHHAGEIRRDQQAAHTEAQHGATVRGTDHRGRD